MNLVFISYNNSPEFSSPESWIKRIEVYSGVYEWLSKTHTVHDVKQIDYKGNYLYKETQYHFVNFGKQQKYFPRQLNLYVKNLNPDVVIVHGLHHPLQLMQLRFILNQKTKIIAQHHAEKPFTGIKKIIQRVSSTCADACLFASRDLGLDWVKKGNLSSVHKIHEVMEVSSLFYPVDQAVSKLETRANGDPVFLWVGRLNENKDPLTVLKAFLKFVNIQPAARLYMIYHTTELLSEIEALLKDQPHQDAVVLVGQVPHEELLYWFNSADFILSGSFYEGSGTAICEAMSCGCIPIVTDIPAFRMITGNGKCGFLYEAGNETALFNTLLRLKEVDLPEKQKASLAWFKSNLSFEAIARKIQEIAASL